MHEKASGNTMKPHIVIRRMGAGYAVEIYRSRGAAYFTARTCEFSTMREAVGLALALIGRGA